MDSDPDKPNFLGENQINQEEPTSSDEDVQDISLELQNQIKHLHIQEMKRQTSIATEAYRKHDESIQREQVQQQAQSRGQAQFQHWAQSQQRAQFQHRAQSPGQAQFQGRFVNVHLGGFPFPTPGQPCYVTSPAYFQNRFQYRGVHNQHQERLQESHYRMREAQDQIAIMQSLHQQRSHQRREELRLHQDLHDLPEQENLHGHLHQLLHQHPLVQHLRQHLLQNLRQYLSQHLQEHLQYQQHFHQQQYFHQQQHVHQQQYFHQQQQFYQQQNLDHLGVPLYVQPILQEQRTAADAGGSNICFELPSRQVERQQNQQCLTLMAAGRGQDPDKDRNQYKGLPLSHAVPQLPYDDSEPPSSYVCIKISFHRNC